MNVRFIYHNNSNIMIELVLEDEHEQTTIHADRDEIIKVSNYFDRLLNFGSANTGRIYIKVDDVAFASHVIKKQLNKSTKWISTLNKLTHRNFFDIDNDLRKLYELIVPPFGFDLLLQTIDKLN